MRTIKFRAWDGQHITPPFTSDHFGNLNNAVADCEKAYGELMQFTGLHDKNGKEIFEGDIVKLENWNPSICEVVFDRGGFCFRFTPNDPYYPDGKYLEDGEVIGNVWENPELVNS